MSNKLSSGSKQNMKFKNLFFFFFWLGNCLCGCGGSNPRANGFMVNWVPLGLQGLVVEIRESEKA